MVGVWLSILLAIGYIGVYTWQVAEEARQLSRALAATELVLAREQHLSQLDGLAAAAAHELGTPLATITVVAREIERALEREFALCRRRQIAARAGAPLPRDPGQDHRIADRRSFRPGAVVGPDRGSDGAASQFRRCARREHRQPSSGAEPVGARNPAIRYGLGNLIENAVDFANTRVEISPQWTADEVQITISDDGPGFAPEVLDRLRRALCHPSPARAARRELTRRRRLALAWACSSPRPCWNAPAPNFRSRTSAAAAWRHGHQSPGTARILSGRRGPPLERMPLESYN